VLKIGVFSGLNEFSVSNISDLIDRRGESVSIYRRTESGTDEFNRPVYTWTLQATEKAAIFPAGSTAGEAILEAGEVAVGDHVGYFKPDSEVQRNDQVEWNDVRFDVKGVRVHRVGGSTRFLEAVMERMIE